jgi:hypothetical protein
VILRRSPPIEDITELLARILIARDALAKMIDKLDDTYAQFIGVRSPNDPMLQADRRPLKEIQKEGFSISSRYSWEVIPDMVLIDIYLQVSGRCTSTFWEPRRFENICAPGGAYLRSIGIRVVRSMS